MLEEYEGGRKMLEVEEDGRRWLRKMVFEGGC